MFGAYRPIAYTYNGDVYCRTCASKAGIDKPEARDREGNLPGAIPPWDYDEEENCSA